MELTLLQSKDVTVTNTQFVIGAKRYAIRDLDSAEFHEAPPIRWIPIGLLLLGIIPPAASYFAHQKWAELLDNQKFGLTMEQITWLGVVVAVLAMVWLAVQSAKYSIILLSSDTRMRALTSSNRNFVVSVLAAVNQAIRADR